MNCPFDILCKSAESNEISRQTRTNSTNPKILQERKEKFGARKELINITVPYLKHIFYDVQKEKCPVFEIWIDINDRLIKDINDWRWCLSPSLDRLDNDNAYVIGNVQITCRFANIGFRNFSGDRNVVSKILRGGPRPHVGLENFI